MNTTNNTITIPKIRTISEAIEEIKRLDPETAITARFIKEGIADGKIPIIRVGNKVLVNMASIFAFLEGEAVYETFTTTNCIRRIN